MGDVVLTEVSVCYQNRLVNFPNKYLCVFFRLLAQAEERITFEKLQFALQQQQSDYQLHRAQVLRLLNDLESLINSLRLPCYIDYPHRKKTTGPWQLVATTRLHFIEQSYSPCDIILPPPPRKLHIPPYRTIKHRCLFSPISPFFVVLPQCPQPFYRGIGI